MIWDDVRAVAPPQVATNIFGLCVGKVPRTDSRPPAFQLFVYNRLVSRPIPARMYDGTSMLLMERYNLCDARAL